MLNLTLPEIAHDDVAAAADPADTTVAPMAQLESAAEALGAAARRHEAAQAVENVDGAAPALLWSRRRTRLLLVAAGLASAVAARPLLDPADLAATAPWLLAAGVAAAVTATAEMGGSGFRRMLHAPRERRGHAASRAVVGLAGAASLPLLLLHGATTPGVGVGLIVVLIVATAVVAALGTHPDPDREAAAARAATARDALADARARFEAAAAAARADRERAVDALRERVRPWVEPD